MPNDTKHTPVEAFYECNICCSLHRLWFDGDCRKNSERLEWEQIPANAPVFAMSEVDAARLTFPKGGTE